SAKDRATGKEQSITITGQSSLDKNTIDQMISDAEAHAAEDARRREQAEVINNADTTVYQVEKLLSDASDSIDSAQRNELETKLSELKAALSTTDDDVDAARIGSLTEELGMLSQQLGAAMYEQAAAAAAATDTSSSDGEFDGDVTSNGVDDDNIVDAEIVEDDADAADTKTDAGEAK
ncbi:MAG: Hsp70 family protein, partial [bacterium]|nr:Hsp70 family protein [bacterium]